MYLCGNSIGTDDDDDDGRQTTHFKSLLLYKPIGALPGRDNMVLTMVLQII
jgi:hypothetical protein